MEIKHNKYTISIDENGQEIRSTPTVTKFKNMTAAKTAFDDFIPGDNEEYEEHLCNHNEPERINDGSGNLVQNEFKYKDGIAFGCKVNIKRKKNGNVVVTDNTLRNLFLDKKDKVTKFNNESTEEFNVRKEKAADDLAALINARIPLTE